MCPNFVATKRVESPSGSPLTSRTKADNQACESTESKYLLDLLRDCFTARKVAFAMEFLKSLADLEAFPYWAWNWVPQRLGISYPSQPSW